MNKNETNQQKADNTDRTTCANCTLCCLKQVRTITVVVVVEEVARVVVGSKDLRNSSIFLTKQETEQKMFYLFDLQLQISLVSHG